MLRLPILALAAATFAPLAPGQVTYYVQLVDPLDTDNARVLGLNDAGVHTGMVFSPDPTDGTVFIRTAFVSDGANTTMLDPVGGRPDSLGVGLILGAAVVGNSADPVPGQFTTLPTVWLGGGAHELMLLPGHVSGEVWGANRSATIVGFSTDGVGPVQPVVWRRQRLPELLPTPAGFPSGIATAVNAAGTIVGGAFDGTGATVGFVLEPDGTLTAVPQGELVDVNDAGVAVGNGQGQAPPFFYEQGQVTTIPLPPLTFASFMEGINDAGQAVGYIVGLSGVRGIVTDGLTTSDLNDLLDPVTGAGVTVTAATCINASGQIGGVAMTAAGENIGCILTPR